MPRPKAENKPKQVEFVLRVPKELHEAITAVAKEERRSMNGEIIHALEKYVKCKEQSREASYS